METFEQARDTIRRELISDDEEVRGEYMKAFHASVETFSDAMAKAVLVWRSLDATVKGDERRAHVSALVYAAFTLHILSFKLFLSGHIVAAGNQFRQVIETIALALLCSSKDLDVLTRFMADQYSTNDAVTHVLRHAKQLGLKPDALQALKSAQEFYHRYSHITRLTLAVTISFSEEGTYVGASFDEGKIEAYKKEVDGRVGLAKVFTNFVAAVIANVAKW
jgi:uncharacterized membrane protein